MQLLRKKISAVLQHARLIAWSMKKTSRKHYGFKDTRKNNLHKILIEHTNINPIQRKLDYLLTATPTNTGTLLISKT